MDNEEEIRKQLESCNYDMAKSLLIKKFSGGVIPNDLAHLLDRFIANPCVDTAFDLVNFDQNFIAIFELARHGGFTEHLFRKGDIK